MRTLVQVPPSPPQIIANKGTLVQAVDLAIRIFLLSQFSILKQMASMILISSYTIDTKMLLGNTEANSRPWLVKDLSL